MNRLRIIGIIFAVVVLGWVIVYFNSKREPEYQGRKLTDWVKQAQGTTPKDPDHPEMDPNWLKCQAAVVAIKDKAIPFFLEELGSHESKWKPKLVELSNGNIASIIIQKNWRGDLRRMVADDQNKVMADRFFALTGFRMLGTNAQTTWPVLIELTRDSDRDRRMWGFCAFEFTKPPKEIFMPIALRLLKDSDVYVGEEAGAGIRNLYPEEAEKACVYLRFPDLRPAPTNQVIEIP